MQPPSDHPARREGDRFADIAEELERQAPSPPDLCNNFDSTLAQPLAPFDPMKTFDPPTPKPAPHLEACESIDFVDIPASLTPSPPRPADPHATFLPVAGSPTPTVLPELPGYEVLRELGRGGMGVVYLARQKMLQRQVALKMMLGGKMGRQSDLDRFRAEAAALARLQHPGIIQIYEVGEHDGQPYFSLEFAPGGSLDGKIRGSPQSPTVCAELMETLARAVFTAHQAGIIHRDLKPANILLSPIGPEVPEPESKPGNRERVLDLKRWLPKITDFGLAKMLDDDSGQTKTGDVMGTPCYMAPEQAQGRIHELGPACDIYTLGAILYELLTGRPPFLGEHTWDTLSQVVDQEPVPPRYLQLRVPRDLETICLKCLEKSALRRYRTAADLADDLQRFREGRPIEARPVSLIGRGVKLVKRRPAMSALVFTILLFSTGAGFLGIEHLAQGEQLAKQELAREKRSQADRVKVSGMLQNAEAAAATRHWNDAQTLLTPILDLLKNNPDVAEYGERAEELKARIRVGSEATSTYREFTKHCEEARFYQSQLTGLEPAVNIEKTRSASRAALALVGLGDDRQATPTLSPAFTATEKEEIAAACYEQYLALAAAVAEPLAVHKEDAAAQAGKALVLLVRAERMGRKSTRALHLQRASCLAQRGDEAGSREEKRAAEAIDPADAQDFFLLGMESYRQKKYDEAIKLFGQALAKQDTLFWPRYLSGLCHVKQMARSQVHLLAAVRELTRCEGERPTFPWVFLVRGHLHTEARDYAAAERDFKKAENLELSKDARYNLLVNRGALRHHQGKDAEAVADFEQAIRLDPDQYQAHVNLAVTLQALKQLDLALSEYDTALRVSANLGLEVRPLVQAGIHRSRAVLYQHREKSEDEALKDFTEAARLAPLASDHVESGRILLQQRKFVPALSALDEALHLQPDHALAHYLRAEALLELHRPAEALDAVSRIPEKGKTADAYELSGRIRAQLGETSAAIHDYSQALERRPAAATYGFRGWAYLIIDAPRLALGDFDEVVKLDPKSADAHNGRATANVKLGQYRLAVKDAEEAVRLDASSQRVLYKACRVFALAVARVESDANEPNRAALMREYQDRATVLLRKALESLPTEQRARFWQEQVQNDTAFVGIYRSTGYQRLKSEYGKALR